VKLNDGISYCHTLRFEEFRSAETAVKIELIDEGRVTGVAEDGFNSNILAVPEIENAGGDKGLD